MLAKLSERIKPSITRIFTVLVHALDWLNALSSFKTALAVRQLEKIYNDHASKGSEDYLWILVVVKASLDVVMSVAASVILSLLLISGDVEENPGPGGNNIIIKCVLVWDTFF